MTAEDLHRFTQTAVTTANSNENRVAVLDGLVKARWGAFDPYPIQLNTSAGLSAVAIPPYLAYRNAVSERLRKMEPTNAIPFVPVVRVSVTPTAATAPDVIKVVVVRNGQTVQPIGSTLVAREFRNNFGATAMLHGGEVAFPLEAFAPGGLVVISLIPEAGENMVTPLKVEWLSRFK